MAASGSLSPAFSPTQRRGGSRSSPAWFPSPEQGTAINALLSCKDSHILAWLTVFRSIEPNSRYRSSDGPGRRLSQQQFKALLCLCSTPDEEITEWLALGRRRSSSVQSGRLSRGSTLNESQTSTDSSTDDAFAPSVLTSCSETPVENLDTYQKDSFREPEIQALEKGILKLNKPIPPPPLEVNELVSKSKHRYPSISKDGHLHWSTSRENTRLYRTCDGFRRQENEREMHYVFMPEGPIEDSPRGHRCVLCHVENPDEDHLRYHDVLQFAQPSKSSLKRSRRGEFERLLRAHNVPDPHIDRLVRKWHVVQKKKAYSCGLCIKLLSSLSERTTHMCHDHFGKDQNMDNWNDNNLIRGLLLQPELRNSCRSLFKSDPSRADSVFVWPSSMVKDLQYKLELGRDAPHELALLAFKTAERTENPLGNQDIVAAGSQFSLQTMAFATAPATQHPNAEPGKRLTMNETYPPASTAHYPDAQEELGSKDDVRDDARGLPNASAAATDSNPYPKKRIPVQPDSLDFNTTAQTQATRYTTEGVYGLPVSLEDFMNIHPRRATITDEEHGMYMPPSFATPPLINSDAMPAFDSSPSQLQVSWYMQDPVSSPRYETRELGVPTPAPKRKLSQNSTNDAHSRSQTMSPMGALSGTQNAPIVIQEP